MAKRSFLILILAAVVAGGAFAQHTPKHTLTVDFGPTIVGGAFGWAGSLVTSGDDNFSSSGFGIGAQYELQPFDKLSFAARFAYLGFNFGYSEKDYSGVSAKIDMGMSSFSVEGHVRLYPFGGGVFFVDGMAGYGRLMTNLSGQVIVEGHGRLGASISPARDYIKLGGKLGWRFCFGQSGGGLTFEPSLGYYYGIGLGDTIGRKLANSLGSGINEGDIKGFDDAYKLLEQFIFIGGPRLSLALGWRF
jgi:hypothetical protein